MGTELAISNSPLDVIDRAPHLADSTKAKYKQALARYFATGHNLADVDALIQHAQTLPTSGRAFLKAAVRLLTKELAVTLKGQATPTNLTEVQAALYRLEAMQEAIKVKQPKGTNAHTWLTQQQVKALFDACQNGIVGQRDRLAMGLMVAAGLRRTEAAALRFENVKLQPVKGRIRTVLEVQGKGAKARVVPISDTLAAAIDEWAAVVGNDGYVVRSLGMNREPGDSISSEGVGNIIAKRGALIGKPGLQPHDLRRTYAQLGFEAGIPLPQISKLLGHASLATTQRYLNLDLDLETTISDFIPF